jgi:hypothetical protein
MEAGEHRFADAAAVSTWLGDLDRVAFRSARESGGTWTIELEAPIEDDYAGDDQTRPLWLMPARDHFQRITFRASAFEEERPADLPETPLNGGLVDQLDVHESDGVITLEMILYDRHLYVRGPVLLTRVHVPEDRASILATDPDVVRMTFSGASSLSDLVPLPKGIVTSAIDSVSSGTSTFELRRAGATAEVFVELLQYLGEASTFLHAESGDERFEAEVWLDYVAPNRRPW